MIAAAGTTRAEPATSLTLTLPRSADGTLTLTITVEAKDELVVARFCTAGRFRNLVIARTDLPRLHRHSHPELGGLLWLGSAGFPLSAVEVDAVRDLFHAHCIPFEDARETP